MSPYGTVSLLLALLAAQAVRGYMYHAVSMFERDNKIHCEIHAAVGNYHCKHYNNAIGMVCNVMNAGVYIMNFYAQRCPITGSLCEEKNDSKYGKCAEYSGCFTVSDRSRVCTCMPGFFGNPYVKCFKQCETDLDCPSPYAECRADGNEKMKRCKCKDGCPGDGVICKPHNICKEIAAGTEDHRRCLQTSVKDKTYVCDEGYYLDTYRKCVKAVELTGEKHVRVVGTKFEDGSRIDIGKCLSMIINKENGESHFYQMNGGDAIVVKEKLVTSPQLYLDFEVKKNDIIAYGLLDKDQAKLTKLFTVSNGLGGCVADSVTKYGPTGTRQTDSNVMVQVTDFAEVEKTRTEL